jgi:hypothetical protein
MSTFYELIGRLVVGLLGVHYEAVGRLAVWLIRYRYGRQIKIAAGAGLAAIAAGAYLAATREPPEG